MTGEVGSEVSLGSGPGCGGLSLRAGWCSRVAQGRSAEPGGLQFPECTAPRPLDWVWGPLEGLHLASRARSPKLLVRWRALLSVQPGSSVCHCSPPCSLARFLPRKLPLQHPQKKKKKKALASLAWRLRSGILCKHRVRVICSWNSGSGRDF